MAKEYKIRNTGEINWPECCAACRSEQNLTTATTSGGRIAGFTGITITGELTEYSYPVCATHAKGLDLDNLLTRRTLGVSLLRWMTYILGAQALLTLPIILIGGVANLFGKTSSQTSSASFGSILFFAVLAALFVKIILAKRNLPIRVLQVRDDHLTIKFKNSSYAEQFRRLNQENILRR